MATRIDVDPRFQRGQQIGLNEIQRVADLAGRTERMQIAGDQTAQLGSGGFVNVKNSDGYWHVQPTFRDSSTGFFSWIPVRRNDANTGWELDDEGPGAGTEVDFEDMPLIEINNHPNVPLDGSVVRRAWLGEDGQVYFDYILGAANVVVDNLVVQEDLDVDGDLEVDGVSKFVGPSAYPPAGSMSVSGAAILVVPVTGVVVISPVVGSSIVGIVAPLVDGIRFTIVNLGTNSIPLVDHDSGTAAAWQLACPYNINQWLRPGFWAELQYDLSLTCWRVMFITDVTSKASATDTISANKNDYGVDPAYPELVITATGDYNVTGLEGLLPGQLLHFVVDGSGGSITFKHLDTDSLVANRIVCPGLIDFKLLSGAGTYIFYDGTFYRILATREKIGSTELAYGDTDGSIKSSPDITRASTAVIQLTLSANTGAPGLNWNSSRAGGADLQNGDNVGEIIGDGAVNGSTVGLGKWEMVYSGDGTTANAGFNLWVCDDTLGLIKAIEGFHTGNVRLSKQQTVDRLIGTNHTDGHLETISLTGGLSLSGGVLSAAGVTPALTATYIGYGSGGGVLTGSPDLYRQSDGGIVLAAQTAPDYAQLILTAGRTGNVLSDGHCSGLLEFFATLVSSTSITGNIIGIAQTSASDTTTVLEIGAGTPVVSVSGNGCIITSANAGIRVRGTGKVSIASLTASKYVVTNSDNNLASQTGVPVGDLTGFGSGVSTWLASPSSANLYSAMTDKTGTAGTLMFSVSAAMTGTPTAPTAVAGTNTTQIATTAFVTNAVTSLLKFQGATDCSGNPNYPAAVKGDGYIVSVAGKIGGASGTSVDVGDWYIATADNAGGTEASVGSSWGHMEHNLVGALLASNNLSDVANAATAVNNLGGATSTGSGGLVRTTSPSLVTPALGTPSALVGTNITGTAASLTAGLATALATPRAIYGNNFDGTAALAQIIASTYGGTGNGFTKLSGPTTSEKTKTLRDATDTILELGGSYTPTGTWTNLTLVTPALGTPTALVLTNATGLPTAGHVDNSVTFAKLVQASVTSRIVARKTTLGGNYEECSLSDILDFVSTTQGVVLYRGASTWAALAPGSNGDQLTSGGASANPSWVTPTAPAAPAVASQSDQETATSTSTYVTPGHQQSHPTACKGFVIFTVAAGTVTVRASYNVTSVTRSGAGLFTINWTTAFSSKNYSAVGSSALSGSRMGFDLGAYSNFAAGSLGAFAVFVPSTGVLTDPDVCCVHAFGDQ